MLFDDSTAVISQLAAFPSASFLKYLETALQLPTSSQSKPASTTRTRSAFSMIASSKEIRGRSLNRAENVFLKLSCARSCEMKLASSGVCRLNSVRTEGTVHANIPAFQRKFPLRKK